MQFLILVFIIYFSPLMSIGFMLMWFIDKITDWMIEKRFGGK